MSVYKNSYLFTFCLKTELFVWQETSSGSSEETESKVDLEYSIYMLHHGNCETNLLFQIKK